MNTSAKTAAPDGASIDGAGQAPAAIETPAKRGADLRALAAGEAPGEEDFDARGEMPETD